MPLTTGGGGVTGFGILRGDTTGEGSSSITFRGIVLLGIVLLGTLIDFISIWTYLVSGFFSSFSSFFLAGITPKVARVPVNTEAMNVGSIFFCGMPGTVT